MPLDLLNNVFLLHLALKSPQSVFEGFSLLQSYFGQRNTPPNSSQFGLVSYCKISGLSQVDRIDRVNHVDPEVLVWVDERQLTAKEFSVAKISETKPQSYLNLPRSVGISSPSQTSRNLVIPWEVNESEALSRLEELHHVSLKAVICDIHPLIVAIQ